jgi:hypothetical protein
MQVGLDEINRWANHFGMHTPQPSQGPQHPWLQPGVFQKIPIRIGVRNQDTAIFTGQAGMPGQNVPHGFRRPPADTPRFIIQVPHQPSHHNAGGLDGFIGKAAHHPAHGRDRPPADQGFGMIEQPEQGVDDLSGGHQPQPLQGGRPILRLQQTQDLGFELSMGHEIILLCVADRLIRFPGDTILWTVFNGFVDAILWVRRQVDHLDIPGAFIQAKDFGAQFHATHAHGAGRDIDGRYFHAPTCSLIARPMARPSS